MANYKVGCKKLKNRSNPRKIKYQSSLWTLQKEYKLFQQRKRIRLLVKTELKLY